MRASEAFSYAAPVPAETGGEGAPAYIVIAGHGRSGSNRLLDALDRHERTFCRNEPNELAGGALAALEEGFFEEDLKPGFLDRWRRAIGEARVRCGARDRFGAVAKRYDAALAGRACAALIGKRRARRLAAAVWPQLRQDEWPAAPLHIDRAALEQSLPVFKIIMNAGWLTRTHAREPGQRVVHNIRDPRAFLRSWRRRYAERIGPRKAYADNLASLDRILRHYGRKPWAGQRDFSEAALCESELWRWRYLNETLWRALKDSPRYRLVRYEDYDADSLAAARRLYGFAHLGFADRHARRIAAMRNTLFARARPGPAIGDAEFDALADRVLGDSSMHREVYAA